MRGYVTGCAGFIGSNLVDALLEQGWKVKGIDNFSTGQKKFIEPALSNPNFELIEGDLLDETVVVESLQDVDVVFHLAANADVRFGLDNPRRDVDQNILATFNILEATRKNGIKKIVFSSTGSVYGDSDQQPFTEHGFFPKQTSIYGASKLAAEGLIQAYSEGFGIQSFIFRFVSILGDRYSHGHVYDFYRKLLDDPNKLEILGNGKQRKSYLHVQDCVQAILIAIEKCTDSVNILNLGCDEYCEVNDSVTWISEYLNISPKRTYTGGDRGWVGDNPFIFLDCSKMRELGWTPHYSIREGVVSTLQYLERNKWIFESRN